MFAPTAVASVADMPLTVTRFVGLEVIEGPIAATGHRASVSVTRIETVINMTIKAPAAMEPRAGSNEQPPVEPIRSIVSIGRAVIRSIVIVSVGASRLYANADSYLGGCCGHRSD
jgi:hypothetical protein